MNEVTISPGSEQPIATANILDHNWNLFYRGATMDSNGDRILLLERRVVGEHLSGITFTFNLGRDHNRDYPCQVVIPIHTGVKFTFTILEVEILKKWNEIKVAPNT